jgi:hypothetical protein
MTFDKGVAKIVRSGDRVCKTVPVAGDRRRTRPALQPHDLRADRSSQGLGGCLLADLRALKVGGLDDELPDALVLAILLVGPDLEVTGHADTVTLAEDRGVAVPVDAVDPETSPERPPVASQGRGMGRNQNASFSSRPKMLAS